MKYEPRRYLAAARLAAGLTQEDAGAIVGRTRPDVSRQESGSAPLVPDEAIRYAEAYDAPELLLDYCRCSCSIGCRILKPTAEKDIAQISTQIGNRLRRIASAAERLAEIADDNVVDAGERAEFDDIVGLMSSVEAISVELQRYAMTYKKAARPCAGGTARRASREDAGVVYAQYNRASTARQ